MRLILMFLLIILGVGLSISADIFLKKSNGFSNLNYFIFGLLLYAATAVPVTLAFKLTEFGILFLLWEAFMVIIGIIMGSLIFGESITKYKFLSLLFVIAGIILSYK